MYHLNGTERLACTMTCLCARRIDVQRVASYARGRAELARKSLVVEVAIMSRRVEATNAHSFHGESHVRWLTAPVVFKKRSLDKHYFSRRAIRMFLTKNVNAVKTYSACPPSSLLSFLSFSHGKNGFTETSKNLTRYRFENIIILFDL